MKIRLLTILRNVWFNLTYEKLFLYGSLLLLLVLFLVWVVPEVMPVFLLGILWFLFLVTVMLGHRNNHFIKLQSEANRSLNDIQYEQLAALLQMQNLIRPRLPLPSMRGGAASPDLLLALYREIVINRPSLVVECGAGVSTIWIGYILEQLGKGKLISIEHDPTWAERVGKWVQQHQLNQTIEIVKSELKEVLVKDQVMRWYDLDPILHHLDHPIDFLFIDGPVGVSDPKARFPAIPLLQPYLSVSCIIMLDDACRFGEQQAVFAWEKDLGYEHEFVHNEKGLAILFPHNDIR